MKETSSMMQRKFLTGTIKAIITIFVISAAMLAATTCFAQSSDAKASASAIAKQSAPPASVSEAQRMPSNSDATAIPTWHFEAFWLLALGATLMIIAASIKYVAGTEVKAQLMANKTKRAL